MQKEGLRTVEGNGVFSVEGALEELNAFEDALGRDKTSIRKEMGEEGLSEVQKAVEELKDDPYMLNVKIQDMSDTLILRAFGRVRNGTEERA
ncbi:hypothetical protein IJI72_01430 [Candidatus Saccharibacteria bacterium]|nr:hypothetical protein [Candidatus Saccharibacteria bacterium]